jgi:carbonic anhydrase/acetyltransferase-like protein (isoleucine patch superfamily)
VVGANTVVNQNANIGEGAIIGMKRLDTGALVEAGAKVGDSSIVGRDSRILTNATVGCFAAPASFVPQCPGSAIGALERNVTVQPNAVAPDGAVIPKECSCDTLMDHKPTRHQ